MILEVIGESHDVIVGDGTTNESCHLIYTLVIVIIKTMLNSYLKYGGEGGIRTLEGLSSLLVFKTSAFNRSATSPIRAAILTKIVNQTN